MAVNLIQRLFDFTPGTIVASAQVNAELDQLMSLFSGNFLTITPKISVNLAEPALTINQDGNGNILEAYLAGVLKLEIKNNGQIKSYTPQGTAPFVLPTVSASPVPNLNVSLLDGLSSSEILQSEAELSLVNSVYFEGISFPFPQIPVVPTGNTIIGLILQQQETIINVGSYTEFVLTDVTGANALEFISIDDSNDDPTAPIYKEVAPYALTSNYVKIVNTAKTGPSNNHKNVTIGVVSKHLPI